MRNESLDAATEELERCGVPYEVQPTRKHVHIRYGANLEHLHVVASSASDWRAPLNERALMRRHLREKGYDKSDEIVPVDAPAVTVRDGQARCLSTDIAARFDKQHKDVLRSIDKLRAEVGEEFDRRNFAPIDYLDAKGRSYRAYELTRDGFSMVAMGFTGSKATAWKVKYIEAFNAMEGELAKLDGSQHIGLIRSELDALLEIVAGLPPPEKRKPNMEWKRRFADRKRRKAA